MRRDMITVTVALVAVILLVPSTARASDAAGEHGIALSIGLDEPKCEFDMIEGTMTARHNDAFGDTTELRDAFVTVQTAVGNVRVPAAGMHLEIIEVIGNTTAVVGGSLPVLIGPANSFLSGLPGVSEDGAVRFRVTGYTIQPDDPDPLRVFGSVLWSDLCDEPDTVGCDDEELETIVLARTDIYHPRIALEKSADVTTVCEGQEQLVTYSYKVTNPGNVALGVELTDDPPCDFPVFVGGDDNGSGLLDPGEMWMYECMAPVSTATANTARVMGETELVDCTATDEVTFEIGSDPAPVCRITGPTQVCPGALNVGFNVEELTGLPDATFEWFLEGDGVFCSPRTGSKVCVAADDECGGVIELRVVVTAGDCQNECLYTVNIDDTAPPFLISGPDDEDLEGCPDDVPTFGTPVFGDDCGFAVIEGDPMSQGSCPTIWTKTWFARDACGNASDPFTQTITIDDTTAPVLISGPDDEDLEGCPDDVPTFGTPVFDDDCAFEVIAGDPMREGLCPSVWTKTWYARDVCGNESDSFTQTITIDDTVAPVLVFGPDDEELEGCPDDVPTFGVPVFDDACGAILIEGDLTNQGTCPTVWTQTWFARDPCGNDSDPFTQTITIDDTTPPEITSCPADMEIGCDVPLELAVEAVDECTEPADLEYTCTAVFDPPGSGSFEDLGAGRFRVVFSADGSVTVTCVVADACANDSAPCEIMISAMCGNDEFCGFTQGYWGNAGGRKFGFGTLELIEMLIGDEPLVIGVPGERSFTIAQDAAECIIDRLPGGGPDRPLPVELGDSDLAADTCQTAPVALPTRRGRFRNNLLAQTISLSLNVRIGPDLDPGDPDGPRGPGGFVLQEHFCTATPRADEQAAHTDPDAIVLAVPLHDGGMLDISVTDVDVEMAYRESGDEEGGDAQRFWIDPDVIGALDTLYGSHTVNDLLALANRALASLPTEGVSRERIKDAVDTINNAFDECRVVVPCPPATDDASESREAEAGSKSIDDVEIEDEGTDASPGGEGAPRG